MDEAFEAEALAHLDLVYSVARRMVPSPSDAQDLVQETYVRALSGWRRQRPDDVAAWLVTICRNTARDGWRRAAARPIEVFDHPAVHAEVADDDTAARALSNMDGELVHRALWKLPEATREAITMVDLAGLTHAEAAGVLEVPVGTMLARVHRGRKALAALIREEVGEYETRS